MLTVRAVAFSLPVDTAEPVGPAPSIRYVLDDAGGVEHLQNGSTTYDARPTPGQGQPNAVLTFFGGANNPIGSVKVDANGYWRFTPENSLSDGAQSLFAMDTNGQSSGVFSLTVDMVEPVGPAPTIDYVIDNAGTVGSIVAGGTSYDIRTTLSGSGQANGITTLYDGANPIRSVRNWSFTPDTELSEGSHSL